MASLNVRGPRFSFEGPEGETLLLDCDNYLSNKSRVSMHRMPEQNFPTIPEILMGLIQRQQNEEEPFALPFGLMDVLLASRLIRSREAGEAAGIRQRAGRAERPSGGSAGRVPRGVLAGLRL